MSVSAAPPVYADPERLVPMLPSERADTAAAAAGKAKTLTLFAEGDDSPSFWDILDVINPLQHIPVLNTLYREWTGDQIGVGARLAGGTLFGGPVGLIASVINCAIEEETGQDAGAHVLALFRDDPPPAAPPAPAVAQAGPIPPAAPAMPADQPAAALAAIAVPDDVPAAAHPAGPLMFGSDGVLANPRPLPSAGPPTPLGHAPRFMPVPPRLSSSEAPPPPPVSVPVSNSSARSNVPVTGRNPLAAGPSAVAVQKAMAAQGLAGVEHPMLPPAAVPAAPVSATAKPAGASVDWFTAMSQALDKYERSGNLVAKPAPTQVTVQ